MPRPKPGIAIELHDPEIPWDRGARCAGSDPDLFFNDAREQEAKQVCADCPIRDVCLERALVSRDEGVWGGTTQKERRNILRRRRAAAAKIAA